MAAAMFFAAAPFVAHAQNNTQKSVESKKAEANKLQRDIAFLDRQIAATKKKRNSSLAEVSLLKKKVAVRKQLIDRLDSDIRSQGANIISKTAELNLMQQRLDTLRKYCRKMIGKAYRNRDSRLWFMYILASDNIEQGYRRWSYLKSYSKSLNSQAKKIKEVKAKLEKERSRLAVLQTENIKTQKAKTEEYNEFSKEQQRTQRYVNSLTREQSRYKAQLSKKRQQAAQLNREIQRLIAQAIASERSKAGKISGNRENTSSSSDNSKRASPMVYTETPESAKLSDAFENNKGSLPWPVRRGVITEGYGVHSHPVLKNVTMPFNNGVNISAPRGCSIQSVFKGTVKQIIVIPGYSHCVLIQHGQYFTFYCKLGNVSVRVGEKVSTGQTIGSLDTSLEESEVHFELWSGNNRQNPENWLKRY